MLMNSVDFKAQNTGLPIVGAKHANIESAKDWTFFYFRQVFVS